MVASLRRCPVALACRALRCVPSDFLFFSRTQASAARRVLDGHCREFWLLKNGRSAEQEGSAVLACGPATKSVGGRGRSPAPRVRRAGGLEGSRGFQRVPEKRLP